MTTKTMTLTTLNDLAEQAADPLAAAMAREVVTLAAASVDAVVDTRRLRAAPVDGDLPAIDRVALIATTKQGELPLALMESAHRQLADKVGVPFKYYERMLEASPELLVTNLNHWLEAEPDRRMLRMLAPITADDREHLGRVGAQYAVRAVLGERYRPLDHAALLNVLLPLAVEHGAKVKEYALSPQRFHVRFVGQETKVEDVVRRLTAEHQLTERQLRGHAMVNGRDVSWVNEILRAGVSVRNSETGQGALAVERFFDILRCTNGYVMHDVRRVRHIGGRNEEEEATYTAQTKRLEDATIFLKIRDEVEALLSGETAELATRQIAQAAAEPIKLTEDVPFMEFMDNVGASFSLREEEIEVLKEETAAERGLTGQLTRWTVAQGMTATAKRIHANAGEEARFGRKAELEAAGWQVLEDGLTKLLKAGGL